MADATAPRQLLQLGGEFLLIFGTYRAAHPQSVPVLSLKLELACRKFKNVEQHERQLVTIASNLDSQKTWDIHVA
jgi:hypothetical protein